MSELNDLITKLCPDGVQYKKLGDLCVSGNKGMLKKNELIPDGKYPVVNGGMNYYGHYNQYNNDKDCFVFSSRGSAGYVSYQRAPFYAAALCYPFMSSNENIIMTRFIYFFLKQNEAKNIDKLVAKGSIPALNKADVLNLEIPVPPLPVQEEVVRILDSFTELEAELEAELADRKEQYEYYRDYLLDKKNLEHMDGKPVETKRLDEIFNLKNGYTPAKNNAEYWKNGDVNWFRMDDIRTNGRILSDSIQKVSIDGIKGGKLFEADSLIVSTSATIGEHALITVPFMCNQRFACLTRKTDYKPLLDMKFMFYYASKLDKYCLKNINQGGFASVSMPAFKEFPIPLPSLATQERIVDILDRFDTLTTSLTDGIPAEIAMRREQYEYCRSRLLDFPCLSDSSASDGE